MASQRVSNTELATGVQKIEHVKGRTWTHPRTGEVKPACDECGFPVWPENGLTQRKPQKRGTICPKCGRRAVKTPSHGYAHLPAARAKAKLNSSEVKAKAAIGRVAMQKRENESTVAFLLRQKAEERADEIVAPFFNALEQEADPTWKASTKLRFYLDQMRASESIMNRVDGMPVARQRSVDVEDRDVAQLPEHVTPEIMDDFLAQIIDRVINDNDFVNGSGIIDDAEFMIVDEPIGDGDIYELATSLGIDFDHEDPPAEWEMEDMVRETQRRLATEEKHDG